MKKVLSVMIVMLIIASVCGCKDKEKTESLKPEPADSLEYRVAASGDKKALEIYGKKSDKPIQTIEYESAEDITEKDYYFADIDFDGSAELLLPAERSASALFFNAYGIKDDNGKYILISSFRRIPNPAIDSNEKVILSCKYSDKTAAFAKYSFRKKEFECIASLFWQPADLLEGISEDKKGRFYVKETKEGRENELFVLAGVGGLEPDFSGDGLEEYMIEGSYWALGDKKWENYFYSLKGKDALSPDEKFLYNEFLINNYEKFADCGYAFRDIDGNGIIELLLLSGGTKLTVFTARDAVTELGSHDFVTATLQLLYSEKKEYPGIFCFTVGGGWNSYGYITLINERLSIKKIFDEDFSGLHTGIKDENVPQINDMEFVSEAESVYKNSQILTFESMPDR